MGTVNRLLQNWKASQERAITGALTLPSPLQRALLDHIDLELTAQRAAIETELAELQQEVTDLAAENERQASTIQSLEEALESLMIGKAAAEGQLSQLSANLDAARDEVARERSSAEAARTELAKSLLQLDSLPRLEIDLAESRAAMETQRPGRISAEQAAAVLGAQRDDLIARIEEAKAQTGRADERADRLATELAKVRADLDQARLDARQAAEAAAELRGKAAGALQQAHPSSGKDTTVRRKGVTKPPVA